MIYSTSTPYKMKSKAKHKHTIYFETDRTAECQHGPVVQKNRSISWLWEIRSQYSCLEPMKQSGFVRLSNTCILKLSVCVPRASLFLCSGTDQKTGKEAWESYSQKRTPEAGMP